jgi:hypothetical protein
MHAYQESEYFDKDIATFVGMLIGRRAIAKCGLPNKEMFIYCDDAEYSLRIKQHGGRIVTICKSCIVTGIQAMRRIRRAILGGKYSIYWPGFAISVAMMALLIVSGICYFRKTERTFADVI